MRITSIIDSSLKRSVPVGLYAALHLLGKEIIQYRWHRTGVRKAGAYVGQTGLKLNIGCGHNRKQGWVNIDLSPEAEVSLDMRERMPFADGSATIIYSEHFFEHLDYPHTRSTFCARVSEYWNLTEFFG